MKQFLASFLYFILLCYLVCIPTCHVRALHKPKHARRDIQSKEQLIAHEQRKWITHKSRLPTSRHTNNTRNNTIALTSEKTKWHILMWFPSTKQQSIRKWDTHNHKESNHMSETQNDSTREVSYRLRRLIQRWKALLMCFDNAMTRWK